MDLDLALRRPPDPWHSRESWARVEVAVVPGRDAAAERRAGAGTGAEAAVPDEHGLALLGAWGAEADDVLEVLDAARTRLGEERSRTLTDEARWPSRLRPALRRVVGALGPLPPRDDQGQGLLVAELGTAADLLGCAVELVVSPARSERILALVGEQGTRAADKGAVEAAVARARRLRGERRAARVTRRERVERAAEGDEGYVFRALDVRGAAMFDRHHRLGVKARWWGVFEAEEREREQAEYRPDSPIYAPSSPTYYDPENPAL